MTNEASRWLTCSNRRPQAKVRLVCFPHAGGAASAFATWHRDLPADIEVCALQLPGREERRTEKHRVAFKPLIDELVVALREVHDRPVALFGYSMGALIAFEYARAARKAGTAEPVHLFVGARKAPHLPIEPPVHDLPEAQFIRETTRRYGGIPQVILEEPELLAHFLPLIRRDLQLLDTYRFETEAPLRCPITAFGGTGDHQTDASALEDWAKHADGRFELQLLPGGHFFITQARRAVLDRIANALLREPAQTAVVC